MERVEIKREVKEELMQLKKESSQDKKVQITWLTLFTDFKIVLILLVTFLGTFNVNFWTGGYITKHMVNLGL